MTSLRFLLALRYSVAMVGIFASFACAYFVALSLSRQGFAEAVGRNNGKVHSKCYDSPDWCTRSSEFPSLMTSELPKWGSYRPGSYFGLKSISESTSSFSTGIMWTDSLMQGHPFRDQTVQDELTIFEWLRHDGRNFGIERLIDRSYGFDINASFVVPDAKSLELSNRFRKLPAWSQKLNIAPISVVGGKVARLNEDSRGSLVFYLGVDCPDAQFSSTESSCMSTRSWKADHHVGGSERGYDAAATMVGHSEETGWFCLFLMAQKLPPSASTASSSDGSEDAAGDDGDDYPPSISYFGLQGATVLSGVERIKDEARRMVLNNARRDAGTLGRAGGSKARKRQVQREAESAMYSEFGELKDTLEDGSSFAAFQVSFSSAVRVDAVFFDSIAAGSEAEVHGMIEEAIKAQSVLPGSIYQQQITESGEMRRLPAAATASGQSVSGDGATATNVTETSKELANAEGKAGSALVEVEWSEEEETVCAMGECMRVAVDQWLDTYERAFDTRFEQVFGLASKLQNQDLVSSSEDSTSNSTPSPRATVPALRQFSSAEHEQAKVCLSSVLGGMAYLQGSPTIGAAAADDLHPDGSGGAEAEALQRDKQLQKASQEVQRSAGSNQLSTVVQHPSGHPVRLLTATPSRTSFPRGFLWDEGFHQLLLSQWDADISTQVLAHWLQAMHFPCSADTGVGGIGEHASWPVIADTTPTGGAPTGSATSGAAGSGSWGDRCVGGWIPREMILGEEARRRVPAEFITQRVNIANPPTLLLVVEKLLDAFAGPEDLGNTAGAATGRCADANPGSSSGLDSGDIGGDMTNLEDGKEVSTGKNVAENDATGVGCETGGADSSGSGGGSSGSGPAARVNAEERARVLGFLRDAYPRLHAWMQWFLHTQRGSSQFPGSFRWRGRSKTDGKVIPNTLASGLDDYPRSLLPSAEEHHVDLHTWMVKATGIMARLERQLPSSGFPLPQEVQDAAATAHYAETHAYLLRRMDELHWSEEHQGYFDVGLNDEAAPLETALHLRCSDQSGAVVAELVVPRRVLEGAMSEGKGKDKDQPPHHLCPPEAPVARDLVWRSQNVPKTSEVVDTSNVTLGHIPRVGYVSIFPLLLRLLPADSPKLGALLDMVQDPHQLWTEYGLRSLGAKDKFYFKKNSGDDEPYWRGYIWIPVNYLAVSALHHYAGLPGPHQARAAEAYAVLREALLRTVLGQHAATGFFWEQYDDRNGKGIRGHPFTGWTALIVNIMAENYH